MPVDLKLKSTLTHQPTLPSGEENYFLNFSYVYQSKKTLYFFVLPSTVQHPSAALPQVSVVLHHWTSVQLMAQLKPTMNPTLSALFTSQVPLTAQLTPMQEIRAHLNAPFIQWTRQPTAPFTLQRLMRALIVPSTTQRRRQTARYTLQGLRIVIAAKTAPCMVMVVR